MLLAEPTHVVIHTAATPGSSIDISAEAIRAYHMAPEPQGKGWSDIGYHWVVRFDGRIEQGRPENQVGAQVEGFNHLSVGICFSGNGDLADLTPQQKASGAKLVADILVRKGLVEAFKKNPMRVLGHRETAQLVPGVFPGPKTTKTCPGIRVDCAEFRRLVMAEIKRRCL